MPSNGKYAPSDIRNLLQQTMVGSHPRQLDWIENLQPAFYTRQKDDSRIVVLDPACDDPKYQQLQSLEQALASLKGCSPAIIIVPLVEKQKIFGLFPRNHWVTLYYDHEVNKATLLDSRPWWVSFLYPRSVMKKLFKKGLQEIYGNNHSETMQFNTVYQAVQYNDTYCGTWTAANIYSLVKGKSITEQTKAFSWRDEEDIAKEQKLIDQLPQKSVWQKFIIFFLSFCGSTKNKPPRKSFKNDSVACDSYQKITDLAGENNATKVNESTTLAVADEIEGIGGSIELKEDENKATENNQEMQEIFRGAINL